MRWILSLPLLLVIAACASIPQEAVGPHHFLTINVIGEQRFLVGDRTYSGESLAMAIAKLKAVHPDLSLDIFIPSKLLGVDKGMSCYYVVGYRVMASVALERQRYFQWSPGDPNSQPIECTFVVAG